MLLALTALATLCLFASFARPLRSIEVWRFKSQRREPPQILALNDRKPRYRDNPNVEVLAFFPETRDAGFWKLSSLIAALGLSAFLRFYGGRIFRSGDPLERIAERWGRLTADEQASLKADLSNLLSFMDAHSKESPVPDSRRPSSRRPASGARHISGEEPHVTSERLRQAQALVSEGMEEREAVARVWQVASGSPAHDQRLGVYRRWLQE